MNFPVGDILSKGLLPNDSFKLIEDLMKKQFSGYIVQSITSSCFEEGVLFFKNGVLLGCVVECLNTSFSSKGKNALPYFLNQTKGDGFYQIVRLADSQVDLVVAFDKQILFSGKLNLKELLKLIPLKFKDNFENEVNLNGKSDRLEDLKRSLIG